MSKLAKSLAAAAGNAGADAPNVEKVFSTYLYKPEVSNADLEISNGIDLAGKGGMVWTKSRTDTAYAVIADTETGGQTMVFPHADYQQGVADIIASFNSDGYTAGGSAYVTTAANSYVSWTFRKAPRFFDVVTYTGNGVAGREIAHSLGVAPGMILIKNFNNGIPWVVYHRGNTSAPETDYLRLNEAFATNDNAGIWNDTLPSDTVFTIGDSGYSNGNGDSFVAYLFAHDPDGANDDGMIACGDFIYGSNTYATVDLPWEPQFLLIKRVDGSSGWWMADTTRGWCASNGDANGTGGNLQGIFADLSNAEGQWNYGGLNPKGFTWASNFKADANTHYIYMAIRAPMMKEPESGTEVFAMDTLGSTGDGKTPAFRAGFPVDMAFFRDVPSTDYTSIGSRLTGDNVMYTSEPDIEQNLGFGGDNNIGWYTSTGTNSNRLSWMFKRAKGFFDVVAYTGDSTNRNVNHSLGVAPEMMWVKCRSAANQEWQIYHKTLTANNTMFLDQDMGEMTWSNWNNTEPTSEVFSVETSAAINLSGSTYIAYLFATLDGVSKVGNYTGTGVAGSGTSLNIDCGFSNGARFVLIKRTDDVGSWWYWDTARGIVTGNDSTLRFDSMQAENTSYDAVDPYSAGFTINATGQDINNLNAEYIFLAIA